MKKVLKASAGTGKTYRLSLEFLAALLSGQNFKEICILTFTRKATAEARQRVLDHLQELAAEGPESEVWSSLQEIHPDLSYSEQEIHSCRKQILMEKDALQIYTIDSFVNHIFRAAVAPYMGVYDYSIIETEQNEEVYEEIFRRLLGNKEYFLLLEEIFEYQVQRDFDSILNYIEDMLAERWKYLLIEKTGHNSSDSQKFITHLEDCLGLLERAAKIRGEKLNRDWFVADYKDILTGYLRLREQENQPQKLRELVKRNKKQFLKESSSFWNGNKLRGKKYADIKDSLEDSYFFFQKNLAHNVYSSEVIPLENRLFKLADIVFAEYDQIKKQQRTFTHSDISNYVYNHVVRGDLDLPGGDLDQFLLEITGSEIKTLFIDEFQDTSVLQWKILEKIAGGRRDFIAVGDAKQSIYQWRGGEKELFVKLPRLIDCREETMSTCYRSDKQILEFVNKFFTNIEKDWKYEHICPRPEAEQGYVKTIMGGQRGHINESTNRFSRYGKEKQEKIRQQNRDLISDLPREIARQLEESFDSYQGTAVLARKNKDLKEIAKYLNRKNIPFILHQEGDLLDGKAIQPLYELLSFLERGEYHALLNFLRSDPLQLPLVDLKFMLNNQKSIEQLLEGACRGEISLTDQNLFSGRQKLTEVLDWVADLACSDFDVLAHRLIAESGVLDVIDGDQRELKNIYRFFSVLREHDSLADFMEFCRENQESEKLREASVQGTEAVDLLTVHKAKGLSFHTVLFYWTPSSLKGGGREENLKFNILFSDDYEHIEQYLLYPSRYDSLMSWLDFPFSRKEEQQKLSEEINNVYVALTRAVHNLLVFIETPVQINPGEKQAWEGKESYGFYEPALIKAWDIESLTELYCGLESGTMIAPEGKTEAEVPATEDLASYFQPAADHKQDFTARQKKEQELDLDTEVDRVWGLAAHYFLEHIEYASERELKHASRLTAGRFGNILGPKRLAEIEQSIRDFVQKHSTYFAEHWRVFTEYEIRSQTEETEDRIRIDRLLVDEDNREILILDFKTGYTQKEEQLTRYKQLVQQEAGPEYEVRTEIFHI